MRVVRLTESRPTVLQLSADEGRSLQLAGRALASKVGWRDLPENPDRSLIHCSQLDPQRWSVSVVDAVGIVVVGKTLQLHVEPKIPTDHLLYLFSHATGLPRLHEQRGNSDWGDSFWQLIAGWYVRALEAVIRRDLLRDYSEVTRELPTVRGRVETIPTADALYAGRFRLHCTFDDFALDTALNRVLKRASAIVAASVVLAPETRRRAVSLQRHLADVGSMRPGDESVRVDRRTRHCGDALALAKHIVSATGRSLDSGAEAIWTFLLRTPPLVEGGLRQLLREHLGTQLVQKRKRRLGTSSLTLNPDLVFVDSGVFAVADVKYKLTTTEWKRPDLYQAVAFAAGFQVSDAAVLEFLGAAQVSLPAVSVGDILVSHVGWDADPTTTAESAGQAFLGRFTEWLQCCRCRRTGSETVVSSD